MSTVADPAAVFVPVPLRWRHVQPGDVFLDRTGAPWAVTGAQDSPRTGRAVVAVRGEQVVGQDVDPDSVITVLVAASERDAATLLITELGARLIESRAA